VAIIAHTSIGAWADPKVAEAVKATGQVKPRAKPATS